ncbi:hypothetical protein KA005_46755 [bacterium]|nr:hypothetical protein [bacterium]
MALVKRTNADVYLQNHASIFAYHPPSRMLVWGCYKHKQEHWELHKNGFQVATGHAPDVASDNVKTLTHWEMLDWLYTKQKHITADPDALYTKQKHITADLDACIRGRISPDRSTIFIHDLNSRYHVPMIARSWPTHIKNALHKVAMYMKEQTTEEQIYAKNSLSISR